MDRKCGTVNAAQAMTVVIMAFNSSICYGNLNSLSDKSLFAKQERRERLERTQHDREQGQRYMERNTTRASQNTKGRATRKSQT